MGLKGSNRRLRITLMANLDFSRKLLKLTAHKFTSITPEGIYICTGNGVISCFQSAANDVHATAAVTDFIVTKLSFGTISESTKGSIFKIYYRIALGTPYI